jgi:hypothetical protein
MEPERSGQFIPRSLGKAPERQWLARGSGVVDGSESLAFRSSFRGYRGYLTVCARQAPTSDAFKLFFG